MGHLDYFALTLPTLPPFIVHIYMDQKLSGFRPDASFTCGVDMHITSWQASKMRKLSSPTDFGASKQEWDTFLQKKGRMGQINFSPCYAPCAGRGALPIPRGAGRHTCARARGRAPLRAPLLAGAGAGWAGRGGGTRRWRSSPSRPSSNHCSVLLSNDNTWTISMFWKRLLHFFTKMVIKDGIFMMYVTLIRLFDRLLLHDFILEITLCRDWYSRWRFIGNFDFGQVQWQATELLTINTCFDNILFQECGIGDI